MVVAVTILHALGSEYRWPLGSLLVYGFGPLYAKFVLRTYKCVKVESEVYAGANVIQLTLHLDKPVVVKPGAYFDITIPETNRWKSHPFSVSYKKGENELVFHIKTWGVKGSFTERLRELASKSDAVKLNPLLQGPYGNLSVRIEEYDSIWLCAGGIGITPLLNTAMQLISSKRDEVSVHFVWVTKHFADIECFQEELKKIKCSSGFHLLLYMTHLVNSTLLRPRLTWMRKTLNAIDSTTPSNGSRGSLVLSSNIGLSMQTVDQIFLNCFSNATSKKSCALVCGPEQLMLSVQKEGGKFGFHVHRESFLY